MPPHPHQNRPPADVQALLDTVRSGTVYGDFEDDRRGSSPNGETAVSELLRQVQSQFNEMAHGRDALAMALREMESQLAKVSAEATSLRSERDHLARLKGLYERKFASIRELAQQ